ncbi:MAG: hypothetical protein V1808_02745 [Candidatus Daviesbacteria bacterium]
MKKSSFIIFIFFIAFAFRWLLLQYGNHGDLLVNTAWGEWIYKYGAKGFYEAEGWIYSSPTQPPLINLLYGFNFYLYDRLQFLFTTMGVLIANYHLIPTKMIWFFDFTKWFGMSFYQDTPFRIGALISMKLLAVFSDILIGVIIYSLAKKMTPTRAIWWVAAYLFMPVSWYLSALWGQYDQISFLFLLITFLMLEKKLFIFAPVFLAVSIGFKPTSLIFIPLFLFLYFKLKPNIKEILISLILATLTILGPIMLFADKNMLGFIAQELIPRIFFKSEFRVSTNAFNFWHILIGDQALNQNTLFLFIPAKIWGWGAFIILNIFTFLKIKQINKQNIFEAMFLIGIGSWLFLTNMLDRYIFSGLIVLLIFSIYQPKIFKYWLILAIIFCLNLFNHWWFPNNLQFLKDLMIWQDSLITRALSFINLITFVWIIYYLKYKNSLDYKK